MPTPTSKRRHGAPPPTGTGPTADDDEDSSSGNSTTSGMKRRSRMASASAAALLAMLALPTTQASPQQPQQPQPTQNQQRGLNALTDLPMTYGQYLPPWATSENYGITYSQSPAAPSWLDPAQAGMTRPNWAKFPSQMLEGQAGELYPDVLSYGPDDWAALQAWVYRACPASVCRAADRGFVPDAQEEAAKEAAFRAWAGASSMASQPNTGATWLHYGADHFQWYYLLARAALANGQGQYLKVRSDLSDPTFQVLRNANGKWSRDSLKGMMDAPPAIVHFGALRFGANQQMQDSLRAQARAFDYGYGAVAALSPFPANTQRYRGYYPRKLQQEPEQAAPPLSPQAQQLQEQQREQQPQPAAAAAGTTGFAGVVAAPAQQEEEGKGLRGRIWGGGRRRRRKRRGRLRHKKKRAQTAAAAAERRQERKHEHEQGQAVNGTAPDAAAAAAASAAGAAAERRAQRHEERRARRRQKRREKNRRLKKQGLAPTVPAVVLLRAPEGDKGGLLYPVATFAHKKTTLKEALARAAQRQADVLAPVIPPGPTGHAPPTPAPVKLKPVVPAYYHGQTQYSKPHRAFPLVVSPPQHLHPKLAAHFGMGPGGPPLDYEHSGVCKNWCPGRRRLHEAEDRAQRWVYVYLGHGAQQEEPQEQPVGVEGDKGMLGHLHKEKKKMPKVTKLIPIDRPAEYYAPPKPTILKPVHRVYTQPEPSVFVIVPRKKAHPWLAKFHGHPFFAAAGQGGNH